MVRFATRKSLALLVYLAVEGERHNRAKLISLLWPESEPSLGQASLRNALTRLRRSLGKAERFLQVEGAWLGLETSGVDLDLDLFAPEGLENREESLRPAIAAYRGDFLEGFSLPDTPAFDDWVAAHRERLHMQMSRALGQLAPLQLASGDYQSGLATAAQWRDHDPLNEAAHRQLIRAYLAAGDKTAAIQVYETLRERLANELRLEPSPESQALYAHSRDFAPRQEVPTRSGSSGWLARLHLPFVGRRAEHTRLVEIYHTVRQQGAQVAVLIGEAGIGKTRLAEEFLAWAAVQGADVLRGRALQAAGQLPYQPLVTAFRARLEAENAPEDLLDDVWLTELSRLLPELRARYPDLPPPAVDESLAPTRLLEAITRLGQALSVRAPVILFIDDAQWSDAATRDALQHAVRDWAAGASVLCLFTLRAEDLAPNPALQAWLTQMERDGSLAQIPLHALTADETEALFQNLASTGESPAFQGFAAWLFRETEGQPFYIAETLQMLIQMDALRLTSDPRGDLVVEILEDMQGARRLIPPGIRQVILARLQGLPTRAIALLTASAVLGNANSFEIICQIADVKEPQALADLDELLQRGLLREETHTLVITHDKIREVVYTEAGAARRKIFHRRALSSLAARQAPHAELAHHALAGRLSEPAFRHSLAAGEAAMAVFAVRDSVGHYEQARDLLGENLPDQKALPAVPELYFQLGRGYELLGEQETAKTVYVDLLAFARRTRNAEVEGAALNRLATLAVHAYQFEEARGMLEQAIQVAETGEQPAGLAQAEWGLAQLYHHQADFENSLKHSRRAIALGRELDDPLLIAGALNGLAYAEMLLGDLDHGERHMQEALQRYQAQGNRALEADCLTALAAAKLWRGDWGACIRLARDAQAISQEIENPWGQIYSGNWLAAGLLDQGSYAEALVTTKAGHEIAQAIDFSPVSIFNLVQLGVVYRVMERVEEALNIHLEAHRLLGKGRPGPFSELVPAVLCTDYALRDNWEAAYTFALEALAHRNYEALPLVVTARWPETEALLRGGEENSAREDVRRWGNLVTNIPRLRIPHHRSMARLARWDGELASFSAHQKEARTLAEKLSIMEAYQGE